MLIHVALASGTPKSIVRRDEILAMYKLSQSGRHQLTDDPQAAQMIVLAGDLETLDEAKNNSLIRLYPEKTFAYSEIDALVPYLPGVYGSAGESRFFNLKRTQNSIYFSRYGSSKNPEVRHRPGESKLFLFSFRGRRDCAIRTNILSYPYKRSDVEILETTGYMHWQNKLSGEQQAQKDYVDMLAHSHFALCPRGMGFGSIRLFEVMEIGVAPVLLADHYALPPGPEWSSFLLQVPEADYAKLPELLEHHKSESLERGQRARQAWEQYFAAELVFDRLVDQLTQIQQQRLISERWYRLAWPLLYFRVHWRQWLRRTKTV